MPEKPLVAEDIAKVQFACDLIRCKGACCTMPGARGAPLREEELEDLRDLRELRKAKADPKNKKGRPIEEIAAELGITLK